MKDEINYSEMLFNRDERLLDYITNLQTIEQQYSAILSENAELENKITNLQKENERLTQGVTLLTNKLIDMTKEKEDYKSRIDKAIEVVRLCNTKCSKEVIEVLGDKENE